MRFPVIVPVIVRFCFSVLALLIGSSALAATVCTMDVRNIYFFTYNPMLPEAVVSTSGAVEVSCSAISPPIPSSVSYSIEISAGLSNSFVARSMKLGAESLNYNIFTNSGLSQVWGDKTGGLPVSGTLFGFGALNTVRKQSHTLYAAIFPLQMRAPTTTSYQDSLNVTLVF
jgi:spore coat protein U-like protein